MKKIGIVTTYRIDNYGTKLQAYTMQKIIEGFGFEAEIVDYYPAYDKRPGVVAQKVVRKIKSRAQQTGSTEKISAEDRSVRHKAIFSFDENYKRSEQIKGYGNLKKCTADYDGFVCGSDQIWAEGNMITDYYNMAFIQGKKPSIAYAPSFGTEGIPEKMRPKYKKMLDSINCISVREESGVSLVKDLSGKEAALVCDPTILAGRRVWDELIASSETSWPPEGSRYVFCYFLGNNPQHRRMAAEAAKALGVSIISLPHMKGFVPADDKMPGTKLYDCSPVDFISLIKGADLVLTDSFHGTVFSLLYNKDFYTFERYSNLDAGSTNNRIYSLLGQVFLSDRIVTRKEQMSLESILWDGPNAEIEKMRSASRGYLEDSFKKTGLL